MDRWCRKSEAEGGEGACESKIFIKGTGLREKAEGHLLLDVSLFHGLKTMSPPLIILLSPYITELVEGDAAVPVAVGLPHCPVGDGIDLLLGHIRPDHHLQGGRYWSRGRGGTWRISLNSSLVMVPLLLRSYMVKATEMANWPRGDRRCHI